MTNEKIRKLIVSEDRFKELLIAEQELMLITRVGRIIYYQDDRCKEEIERINKTDYSDKEIS